MTSPSTDHAKSTLNKLGQSDQARASAVAMLHLAEQARQLEVLNLALREEEVLMQVLAQQARQPCQNFLYFLKKALKQRIRFSISDFLKKGSRGRIAPMIFKNFNVAALKRCML